MYKSKLTPLFVSLLIVFTVMSSGCVTTPTTGNYGNGVTILDFEPEIKSAYSGEEVNFRARIKNMGSFEANDVSASIGSIKNEWNCRDTFTRTDKLMAPAPDRGTEGEEKVFTWECQAPDIQSGMQIPYEARAEIEYTYKSITSKSVTILPRRELITLENAGQSLPSETISKSHSPVEVDIQVKGPIVIVGNSVSFPVNIKISNVGGGIVKDSKIEQFKISGEGGVSVKCDNDGSAVSALPLWRGQSQTLTCTAQADADANTAITQARIVAVLNYHYIISSSSNIDVIGRDTT